MVRLATDVSGLPIQLVFCIDKVKAVLNKLASPLKIMNLLLYRAKSAFKFHQLCCIISGCLGSIAIIFLTSEKMNPPATSTQNVLSTDKILHRNLLFDNWPPDIKGSGLHIYDSRDLVILLEHLLEKKLNHGGPPSELGYVELSDEVNLQNLNETIKYSNFFPRNRTLVKRIEPSKTLHFAFVGDSRMRQLFAMFLKAIPDYDRFVHPTKIDIVAQVPIPFEIIAYSELMGVLVSYTRKHLLLDNRGREMSDFINNWLNDSLKKQSDIPTPHPDFLIMGSFVHHMLRENRAHENVYFEKLEQLLPVLHKISDNCKIVWVYQYPTQELYSPSRAHPSDVHSSKIWGYNQRVEQILKGSRIPIWTSGSPLVEEYIRSCALNRRNDGVHKHYFLCRDYVHPGTSALADMIQMLYNLLK